MSTSGIVRNFFDVISLINLNQELHNQIDTLIEHLENLKHEKETQVTELSYHVVVNILAKAKDTRDNLLLEKQTEISELKSNLDALQSEIKDLSILDHGEQRKLKDKDDDIKSSNKIDEDQKVIKLNKEMTVMRTKYKDEKDALTK